MFTHNCLDPHDPFAEREVLVAFDIDASGIRLIAARDAEGHDILPDLIDAQRDDLRRELAARTGCARPATACWPNTATGLAESPLKPAA